MNEKNTSKLIGQTVAVALCAGTGMAVLFSALYLTIETTFHQSKLVALCSIAAQLAAFFLAPLIGAMADSRKRIRHLCFAYMSGAGLAMAAGIISYLKLDHIVLLPMIISTAVVVTLVRALDQTVRTAIIHHHVAESEYMTANRWLEMVRQGITFLSGGIAIFLINKSNILLASLFCAAAYAIAITLSWGLEREGGDKTPDKPPLLQKTTVLSYINRKNPDVPAMIATLLPYSTVLSLNALYPKAFMSIGASPAFYAALVIPYGAGAIFGSWIKIDVEKISFEKQSMTLMLVFSAAMTLFGIATRPDELFLLIFIFAFCHASVRVRRNFRLMQRVEKGRIGAVASAYEMIAIGLTIALSLTATILADSFGMRYAAGFLASIMLLACALFIPRKIAGNIPAANG